MLLVDNLLLAPVHGLLWIARQVHRAAQEAVEGEKDALRAELTELYRMLEEGRISEAAFADRERILLDRLEAIRGPGDEG